MNSSIYQPQEDTYLILEQVKQFAKGKVLDMGTGTGILAFEAQPKSKFVIALDINPESVKFVQNLIILKNISNMYVNDSNLFSFLDNNLVYFDRKNKKFKLAYKKGQKNKFDTIIFNPPYLPKHKAEEPDVDLYVSGGRYGYEIIEDFLNSVSDFLEPNGNVLVVFSSLTKKNKVEEAIRNNLLEFDLLSVKKLFMEQLYCYRIFKSDDLKVFERRGLRNIKYLAKGHRGIIFTADYKGKRVVVKKQREDVDAKDRIKNEIKFLKKLNKHKIGPRILFTGKDYFVYDYIKGTFIKDFVEVQSRKAAQDIFVKVLKVMYKLDMIGVNKEEMHHPKKHVIIDNKLNVHLIDFERANKTDKPKNVTQFIQYICSGIQNQSKVDTLRKLAKEYKENMSLKALNKILSVLK